MTETSSGYTLEYNQDLKNESNVYQYFLVSSRKVKLKAWAYNDSGQQITSNEIEITIKLPDTINGLYYTSALQDLSSVFQANLLKQASILPGTRDADTGNTVAITLANLEEGLNPVLYTNQLDYDENSSSFSDTSAPGAQAITPDANPAYIPLGFRIKSAGITVAALLDQVTFLKKE